MLFSKNDLYEDTTVQNDTEKGETYECCCEQAKFQKMKDRVRTNEFVINVVHKFRQVQSSHTPCNMQCPEKDRHRCIGDGRSFNKHTKEPLYRFSDVLHTNLPIVVLAIWVLSNSMMKIGKCMVLLSRRSVGLVDTNRLLRRSIGLAGTNHLASCSVPVAWSDIVDFDSSERPVLWCVCSSMHVN